MSIPDVISRYGTAAIKRYSAIAGLDNANEMPEIFLGGVIASGIHEELGYHTHVERLYTTIARELGRNINAKLVNWFGGQRADVAIYDAKLPIAIVEFKKFDDYKSTSGIEADLDKVKRLAAECGTSGYLGVMITDVEKPRLMSCTERRAELENRLGRTFDAPGIPTPSGNGQWEWCFSSMKVA